MAKEYKDLSTEKLRKLLLIYNLFAIVGGVASLSVLTIYFLNRDGNLHLLVVGMGAVSGMGFITMIANKIKSEIRQRND